MHDRRHVLASALGLGAAIALPGCAAAAPSMTPGEHALAFGGVVGKPVALRYLLWMPEPAGRLAAGWPLLIFLHGSGERGHDLARLKAHGPPKYAAAGCAFPFVLVAPRPNPTAPGTATRSRRCAPSSWPGCRSTPTACC